MKRSMLVSLVLLLPVLCGGCAEGFYWGLAVRRDAD